MEFKSWYVALELTDSCMLKCSWGRITESENLKK